MGWSYHRVHTQVQPSLGGVVFTVDSFECFGLVYFRERLGHTFFRVVDWVFRLFSMTMCLPFSTFIRGYIWLFEDGFNLPILFIFQFTRRNMQMIVRLQVLKSTLMVCKLFRIMLWRIMMIDYGFMIQDCRWVIPNDYNWDKMMDSRYRFDGFDINHFWDLFCKWIMDCGSMMMDLGFDDWIWIGQFDL